MNNGRNYYAPFKFRNDTTDFISYLFDYINKISERIISKCLRRHGDGTNKFPEFQARLRKGLPTTFNLLTDHVTLFNKGFCSVATFWILRVFKEFNQIPFTLDH